MKSSKFVQHSQWTFRLFFEMQTKRVWFWLNFLIYSKNYGNYGLCSENKSNYIELTSIKTLFIVKISQKSWNDLVWMVHNGYFDMSIMVRWLIVYFQTFPLTTSSKFEANYLHTEINLETKIINQHWIQRNNKLKLRLKLNNWNCIQTVETIESSHVKMLWMYALCDGIP